MEDKQGRTYAKLSQLSVGDKVQVDGGFTCISPNSVVKVSQHEGRLYIPCSEGRHFLDGQADNGEDLIGIYPVEGN